MIPAETNGAPELVRASESTQSPSCSASGSPHLASEDERSLGSTVMTARPDRESPSRLGWSSRPSARMTMTWGDKNAACSVERIRPRRASATTPEPPVRGSATATERGLGRNWPTRGGTLGPGATISEVGPAGRIATTEGRACSAALRKLAKGSRPGVEPGREGSRHRQVAQSKASRSVVSVAGVCGWQGPPSMLRIPDSHTDRRKVREHSQIYRGERLGRNPA